MATSETSAAQKIARYVLIGSLVALGAWMLSEFLPALCWAVVLAIATSALYDRWLQRFDGKRREIWAALTFTLLIGMVVIVPLVYGAIVAYREAITLAHQLEQALKGGNPPTLPAWVVQLPFVGDWLNGVWVDRVHHFLTREDTANATTQPHSGVYVYARFIGVQVLRRISTLVFTLLTLFFVFLNRESLRRDVPRVARRIFGPSVDALLTRAVEAIRATVDGIVLVAVAEGAVMCGVYAIAGAPHPILFGMITGVTAMIPFVAPVAFGAVALLLASHGAVGGAVAVVVTGLILLFIADHFVRPVIIGEGAKLPFLWVLLGILGGIESFDLVGIFLGPALMAALVALWRTWVTEPVP